MGTPPEQQLSQTLAKADLHIHSTASDGTCSPREIVEYARQYTDLAVIAITDHDRIEGALEAMALASAYDIEVVPGIEVTTLAGHLIGLWVECAFPILRSAQWTADAIREQGGIVVAPHPMSWLTLSLGKRALYRCAKRRCLDAIEVVNSSAAGKVVYAKALAAQQELHLPQVGGSDAHIAEMIGTAYTLFPGRSAADLRKALAEGTTVAAGGFGTLEESLTYVKRKLRLYRQRLAGALPLGR
jgi:predicted metal-dependent phosphoesterase TrpH